MTRSRSGRRGNAPTLADVAREAGVSATTVSHVINGTRFVSEEMTQRVQEAVERLHYEVNSAARSLVRERSQTIGLIIRDITNPFYTSLARAVEDTASEAGYSVILCNTDEDPDRELNYLRTLRQKRVDGILLAASGVAHPYLLHLLEASFPIVVFVSAPDWAACDSAVTACAAGTALATEHVISLGYRRIGT